MVIRIKCIDSGSAQADKLIRNILSMIDKRGRSTPNIAHHNLAVPREPTWGIAAGPRLARIVRRRRTNDDVRTFGFEEIGCVGEVLGIRVDRCTGGRHASLVPGAYAVRSPVVRGGE